MPEEVRLVGNRLDRVRRHFMSVTDHAFSLAEVVIRELQLDIQADDISRIDIHPRNARAIIYDNSNCVGVYEDPPGICRPCGPKEWGEEPRLRLHGVVATGT